MAWRDWVRTVEVEPSLYAADFARLGAQIDELLDAGVRVFHYDVGDGHFVEPITIGPIVLESIAEPIHARGGAIDVHLMVDNPERHIPQVARAGGDSVTFHVEVTDEPAALIAFAREHGLGAGVAFNPQTEVARAAAAAEGADLCLCMSINPGYSGQRFMPEALPRIRELRGLLPPDVYRPGRRRRRRRERPRGQGCRSRTPRRGQRRLRARRPAGVVPGPRPGADVSLERALELAAAAPGRAYPNPTVGAVVVADGEVVGEGVTEEHGGRHGEVVALDEAGERARGATLYLTMEPCTHHGRTPPCVDRVLAAGIARVVAGSLDPNPEAGGGLERLRGAGVEVELADSSEARRQNEAWRTWVALGRPFVTYKAAVTLDGRVTVPGSRWVTGEESRRRVHELRAASDAVAVGMGTFRADAPRLDARDVPVTRQPRRLVFGRGPLPPDSELELVCGPLDEALARLGGEGVQSLLLEGGPTLATAFLRADLVDRLLLFVAPTLSGSGPRWVGELPHRLDLHDVRTERLGADLLVGASLREG